VHNGRLRHRATRDRQDAARQRLREFAAAGVRFRYRRLTELWKRDGGRVTTDGRWFRTLTVVDIYNSREAQALVADRHRSGGKRLIRWHAR